MVRNSLSSLGNVLSKSKSQLRQAFRKMLVEGLERRELMAGDSGPRLLSLATNNGITLDPNATGVLANQLSVSPSELIFRFDGTQAIDFSSLSGITIQREGNADSSFATSPFIQVNPTSFSFGETQQIVIAQFEDPLPNDLYRIQISGAGSLQPVRNTLGIPLMLSSGAQTTYLMNVGGGIANSVVTDLPVSPSNVMRASGVFAQGTSADYVQQWIDRLSGRTSSTTTAPLSQSRSALSSPINLPGERWTTPTGGSSPNEGDPATVSWSIVPDGTPYDTGILGSGNSNVVAFLDGIYGGGTGPLSNRPWFAIVKSAYDRWSELSGITFVYEPQDDGGPINGASRGVSGVRGDVRIGGRNIDGNSNILAVNYYPNAGGASGLDGDMIIDTADNFYNNTTSNSLGLFNVLMHEAGHGIGLGHVIPSNQTKLMEPFVSRAYRGPQHDDILAAQTLYGDAQEVLGDPPHDLGVIANGRTTLNSIVSIDRNGDIDNYNFSTLSSGRLTIRVTPVGQQYIVGPQGGATGPVDTLINKNLSFDLLTGAGTLLASVNANGVGQMEELLRFDIPGNGNYRIRVSGAGVETQLYTLELVASRFINNGVGVQAPRLLSIAPNSGQLLDPNAKNVSSANVLNESPRELVFRFSGSQQLDPASLRGIRITRSGGDNDFTNGNEIVLTPSFLGFGENNSIVVARFGEALPDDRYRIEILGVDAHGLPALQSIDDQVLIPRFAGTDRDTYFLNLELGTKIIAVVPQPVTRLADGTLSQARDQIEVFFNDDDLTKAIAEQTNFYQLILTNDSITPNDDTVFTPSSVFYDPTTDKAVLTFSNNLDTLAGGSGTFRLRIGSNRTVATQLAPQVPIVSSFAVDAGDTLASASTIIGTLSGPSSRLINSTATVTATNQLNLQFPGSNFEPGHRDIQDETHLGGGPDASPNITKVLYNFSDGRSYGFGSNGQPLFSSITPDQRQRVREIFEFYSAQAGIDVLETAAEGLTIVVGDMFPLNNPPPPFTPAGIAGGNLAIMNGALSWNNGLGESFFDVALHEIGHLLGLVHTYDLPSGTVMGSTGQLDSGNPIEFFFPGDHDVTHLQHIHRPDNRDVDIHKFDLQPGQRGTLVVETIAERLSDASDLDTYLTLFKRDATGLHVIAINDNYFSNDSLIRAELIGEVGVEYFIAVTSRGNENYDPQVTGSGSGGTSEGRYQLRIDYRPSEASQIVDTSGTPFDGDGDGIAGGEFNFWFRTATPIDALAPPTTTPKTIFVDKDNPFSSGNGALSNPYQNIPSALAAALPGDIIRLIGSSGNDRNLATTNDNLAYEIGDGGPGKGTLSDGAGLLVPKGVTLMIDAGAIVKVGSTQILVGSDDASSDRSGAAIQVLGTPTRNVMFTSYFDESLGIDTNLLNTTPLAGNWGGIEIRNDIDREQGRREPELAGVFLNYIGQADIRYGGGSVGQGLQSRRINPIHLASARPTLLNNKITDSADAGISADPNSFEETLFTEPRYQFTGLFVPDYSRIGPDIQGQRITNSSTNGLFIRIDTLAGQTLKKLTVAARLNDTDITHVLGENLIVEGTPGGSFKETVGPDFTFVTLVPVAGGALSSGQAYNYQMTFVDRYGNEGIPGSIPLTVTPTALNQSVLISNLSAATGEFVGRRLYRKLATSATWDLIAELDRDNSTYTDIGNTKLLGSGIILSTATSLQRGRRDASLVVDPGVVIKSLGSRIEVEMGANLIAEGTSSKPVIFTSRRDDRYGAGASFDTNNDQAQSVAVAGDWSGIIANHLSSINIDSALITFGGGASSIAGGFATFNAVEIVQASARIANSVLENNAQGNATAGSSNRDFHGPTDASVIRVVASQPVIFNNTIRNNSNSAAISIDANSMKAVSVRDYGRSTGLNARTFDNVGNLGPFVYSNELGGNALNGMIIRGATLTTEAVWDDTDIVHIVGSEIVVPDFHTYGGLRLQSKVDESLVVKFSSDTAGITASGRPLDIASRIGGSLHIVGAPGFPVILTSISDDSAGAGFDWTGRAMLDTNNDGVSTGSPNDWRSIRLNPYSNDRNVETFIELEADPIGDKNRNDLPGSAQDLGTLASNLNGGDENVRLGFTVTGSIAVKSDLDVYSFTATAGTTVWFDIDRSGLALDSVVELINQSGQIIAQSSNSFEESVAGSVFTNPGLIGIGRAFPMNQSSFVAPTSDFQATNPLDAGLRIQLPGVNGTTNKYFIRVRSTNLSPTDAASKLQDLSQVSQGLTVGPYKLQLRIQQEDEVAGSTIRFADIRYANTGIEVLGLPGHSPLVSENGELSTTSTDPATAQDLGNIANSDRSAISISGTINNATDVDFYRFRISRDSIQSPGSLPLGTVFDVDYADGLGRPDTTLWVYRVTPAGNQLVLIGTDSNIADDRAAPGTASSASDLTRGSFGPRDPFIGAQELPDGEYIVAITPASRVEQQFQQFSLANPVNPLFRIEPISSVQRISEDHFETANFPVLEPGVTLTKQVAFSGTANAVPLNLSDVTLFVSQTDERTAAGNRSRLLYSNAVTGAREAELGQGLNYPLVNDIAVSPSGTVVGAEVPSAAAVTATPNDANIGFNTSLRHDGSAQTRVNSGIQTYEAYPNATGAGFQVTQARNGTGNNATPGVGTIFTALSFVDTVAPAASSLVLFAIGQRGNRLPFDSSVMGGNPLAIVGLTPGDETTAYKNILYRLNPDTLTATSPPGVADRAGDRRARGTGTEVREYGVFAEIATYTWDVNNNGRGDDIVVTRQANGDIVGLSEVDGVLYGVTEFGELWSMPMGSFNNGFRTGATLVSTTLPPGLTGLSTGPRNVEGGIYADMLFGITATGEIHAFDVTGAPQAVFPGAASSVIAPGADGLGTVNGIDFAALDVNLWHTSNTRGADAGHGRPINFDATRRINQAGNNSLYFGYEPTGGNAIAGDWTRIYNTASTVGTYDFAGGAAGAIESNSIDLRAYSVDDKPMLYFTYRAETENSNGPNTDNAPMLDAFRVYGVRPDGTSVLLATNNAADDRNYINSNNEFDPDNALNSDVYGGVYKPQTLFDANEAGDTGGWRQARIPLAALAGLNDVKLRFEFSTGGSFRSADPLRGGLELTIVSGDQIDDGESFTMTGPGPIGLPVTNTFEFDLGLVLNLPSGASIVAGDQLTVEGSVFTFVTGIPVGRQIRFTAADTPTQIAASVSAALTSNGFIVATNSTSPSIINVTGGVTPAGLHSVTGLDPAIIIATPGVAGTNIAVPIDQSMTAATVRDRIKSGLAASFNVVGQELNTSVWRSYNNTLQIHNYTVDAAGPLSLATARTGDAFGAKDPIGAADPTRFAQASLRSTNNDNQGIFVDDIIIGLAERGEMVVNATVADLVYGADAVLIDGGYPNPAPIPSGTYQLEIRTAADYLLAARGNNPVTSIFRNYDSNDRLAKQVALVVSGSATFVDGEAFTLSDGANLVTFEFNVITSAADRAATVTPGRIPITISPAATTGEIVSAIRSAINSSTVQQVLRITASATGDVPDGAGGFLLPDKSQVLQLHGLVATDRLGSLVSPLPGISFTQFGLESALGEDLGDSNRRRDQGQIVISSNTGRNSQTYGILVDNAARDQSTLAQFLGDRPYPGSVRNLVTTNTSNLAPGATVSNNIIASNVQGGIRISGDNTAGDSLAASNIARVYNNTIYGLRANDRGILVEQGASATILNNILANLNTGVALVGAGGTTVLGANIYQSNVQNVTGTGTGTFPINLLPTDPLFADVTNDRFYLAFRSQAIDSSLSSLAEIGLLSQVKNSVGLPLSPLIAPDRDITGVFRVDDPLVNTPTGQGQNVNIDRGAVERADTARMRAILANPLDNDSANIDQDSNETYVRLLRGSLDYFSILLSDNQGTGPDSRTVVSESVIVTENGRYLVEGIDYVFGYNAGSNTIRLTPVAGIWRQDSVYEISLINKPTYRIDTNDGTNLVDGSTLVVTVANGTTRTLEYDSGFVLDVQSQVTPFIIDGQTITYQRADGTTTTFEFDLAGTPFNPANTRISVVASDTNLTIADKVAAALATIVTGGSFPVMHLGQGRVHVGGVFGDQIQVSGSALVLTGQPGVARSIRIQTPVTGGLGITDGQLFSIRLASGVPVTFEFDSNNVSTIGNQAIRFFPTDTPNQLAARIVSAINASTLGLVTTVEPNGVVVLNEPSGTILNLLTSNLSQTGVAGGAIELPFVPSATFTTERASIQLIQALNQLGQGVKAYSIGRGGLLVEGAVSLAGFNATLLPVIRDIAGNSVDANRSNSLTQFTIAMPDVRFDFGDVPGATAQTLLSNNGARNAQLPADAIQLYLGATVDTEADGQPNPNATGDDIASTPSDEDGVRIVNGLFQNGFFNKQVPQTSLIVTSSGAGFVDAWIDWNRDGDFTDAGEQVISSQIVSGPGETTLTVTTPASSSVGSSFLRVRLSALGNLLSGGVGIGGETEDYRIDIIDNVPVVANDDNYSTIEDTMLVVPSFGNPRLLANDVDASGTTLAIVDSDLILPGIQPLVSPLNGTLTLSADGSFQYAPNANFTGIDTFVYFASEPVLAGVISSLRPATVTITVTGANDQPVFVAPSTIKVIEDQGSTTDGLGNQVQVPVSIPSFLSGVGPGPVTALDEASQTLTFNVNVLQPNLYLSLPTIVRSTTDPSLATLTFTLNPNVNNLFVGGNNNLIVVSISDNGNPVATSSPQTISIDITPVNDAPVANGNTFSTYEESAITITGASLILLDLVGPNSALDELSTQTLNITSVQSTTSGNGTVVPSLPNSFIYTPAANFVGSDTFTYTISDGVSGNPPVTGTATINVLAVNDAPSFTIPVTTINVQEDQGSTIDANEVQTQVPISIPGFATNVAPGPAGAVDEQGQILDFVVVALEPSFYLVPPAIVRSSTNPSLATLTFTLNPHLNRNTPIGSNNRITVTLVDRGPNDPAIPPPNPNARPADINSSSTQTFSININPVNDPPVPSTLPGPFMATEDSPLTITRTQLLQPVGGSPALPGPVQATDESGQSFSITRIDGISARGGTLSATLDGTGSIASMLYRPSNNYVGPDFFTYTLTDNGGGTTNTTIVTVPITVTPVNDAPLFLSSGNVTVLEDSTAYSALWATGLATGPSTAIDELSGNVALGIPAQTMLPFTVTSTSPELFLVAPAINETGVLTFQLRPNANGNSIVSVRANDSGSGVSPNINQSNATLFTITVTPINDAPIFTPGGNISVVEDAGTVSQAWASGILPAAGLRLSPQQSLDEATQTVSFVVSNNNAGLFDVAPAIDRFGVLTFTTKLNANGSAVVTAFARDSGSGVPDNVSDSAPVNFTITLTPDNDAPIGVDDRHSTNEDTQLIITTSQSVMGNDSDPDGDLFAVVPGQTTSFNGASVTMIADGTFVYDPRNSANLQALANGQAIEDIFTYRLRDANNAVSLPVTVTVTVAGRNDAPRTMDDTLPITFNQDTILDILANDVDVDSIINRQSLVIGLVPSNGRVTVLNDGRVSYVPNTGYRGGDSFTYQVRDDLGALSRETTVQLFMNSPPVANPDSRSTVVGSAITIDVVANDRDPDVGDTIVRQSVAIVSQPTSGTAIVLSNGDIQFTPNAGFTGLATFTYTVADNNGLRSNVGNVSIDVVGSLYQNPRNRFDVNNDGFVSPIDALIVINYLNTRPVPPLSTTLPPNYLDVDGSGFVSAVDILQVINFLNDRVVGRSAEGEAGNASPVRSLATPSISLPLSGTIDVEVLDQKSVQAYVQGQLVSSSTVDKSRKALLAGSGMLGDFGFDDDSIVASVANELSANRLQGSNEDNVGSLLEGVLDELGI
ncbi:MAG: Ig-like domain-containing protein [Planctomycetota bacterium]|nr:Ig-like domain-containing protein [Planctomycetota bacterium]